MPLRSNLTWLKTDRGRRLRIVREVPALPEQAWTLMSTVEHWPEWGPLLTDVRYPHDDVRTDTSGEVQLLNLLWIPFRIRRVEEFFWSWTVSGVTPPSDGHRVEPLGESRCRISFELPLWAIPYVPVCYRALRTMEKLLAESHNDA